MCASTPGQDAWAAASCPWPPGHCQSCCCRWGCLHLQLVAPELLLQLRWRHLGQAPCHPPQHQSHWRGRRRGPACGRKPFGALRAGTLRQICAWLALRPARSPPRSSHLQGLLLARPSHRPGPPVKQKDPSINAPYDVDALHCLVSELRLTLVYAICCCGPEAL